MIAPRPIWLLWLALAAPALWLLATAVRDPTADLDALIVRSGDFAAYLLVAALAVTPLVRLLPALRPLLRQRRAIGLAAFGTGLLHLGLYVAVMGNIADMLAEFGAPGIWTGWAALLLLLPLALTSNDTAMRALGRRWKALQRLIYAAALLIFAHWILVHDGRNAALTIGIPLLLLQVTRIFLPPQTRSPA